MESIAAENYLEINKNVWAKSAPWHFESEFYGVQEFIKGHNSLNSIELEMLGDLNGKTVLHLQCHFGMDTISLARMGARVTGVDFNEVALLKAKELAHACNVDASFKCSDVYSLPAVLNETFDLVFTSYGVLGWLPDMESWAKVVAHFLKPDGKFVIAEFHPVVWMLDQNMQAPAYDYFNTGPIVEVAQGTYANREAPVSRTEIGWNHSLSDVIGNLLKVQMEITHFREYSYSPYNCFENMREEAPGRWVTASHPYRLPMVFALQAIKKQS